jgi:putative spermidine/putrescine transport system ATP-binding protein
VGTLVLEGLRKEYGEAVAVDRVDVEVKDGELVSLLGPSGCGKTTILRMVAGFIEPTAGRVMIAGQDVTRTPPYARQTGMVFQSYALFPHMSVAANVAFGLEMRKVSRAERDQRVVDVLKLVRLDRLADRLPRQLSGGQQQRVALARALVINPAVFLLDEPLSNLDAKLRADVRGEIRALQQRLGLTTLMVTHDQEEALTMSDRLVVMESGRVRQIGTAEELYENPADAFVADFVGRCNIIHGTIEGNALRSEGGILLPCNVEAAPRNASVLALRPERIAVRPGSDSGGVLARLAAVLYLGAQTEYRLDLDGTILTAIRATPTDDDALRRVKTGDMVSVSWDTAAARLLPA